MQEFVEPTQPTQLMILDPCNWNLLDQLSLIRDPAERYDLACKYEHGDLNAKISKNLAIAYKLHYQLAAEGFNRSRIWLAVGYFKNFFPSINISNIYEQIYFADRYILPEIIESLQLAYYIEGKEDVVEYLRRIFKDNFNIAKKLLLLVLKDPDPSLSAEALFWLAMLDIRGQDQTSTDLNAAKVKLKLASEQGHAFAKVRLAEILNAENNDPQEVIKLFEAAAATGLASAFTNLGFYYLKKHREQDLELSKEYLLKGAELNDPVAQYQVSREFIAGTNNFVKNFDSAVIWCKKAAELGYAEAQNSLGVIYADGKWGLEQDYAAAERLFKKATAQNCAEAQFNLAELYKYGRGVNLDHHKAQNLYKQAANNGHALAIFQILNQPMYLTYIEQPKQQELEQDLKFMQLYNLQKSSNFAVINTKKPYNSLKTAKSKPKF